MQAGGHDDAFHFDGSRVSKVCKDKEIVFYQRVFDPQVTDPVLLTLRPLLPAFYGVEARDDKQFVVMENLCDGIAAPCIMDCKLGRISWSPDHTPDKVAAQTRKGDKTTSNILGFRVSGEVIRSPDGAVAKAWKKAEGFFGITAANIVEEFTAFASAPGRVRYDVIREFRDRTLAILEWFLTQKSLSFVATSVLYVYDQAAEDAKVTVRLIDFAHVFPTSTFDHSILHTDVIHGLENLVALWSRILDARSS